VCQFLDIIILCPKMYLDYFWCIKYQYIYIYIYIKIGKEKGKRKGFSLLAGPGGGFWPSRARARDIAVKWAQTAHEERGRRDGRCGHGPTRQREEGGCNTQICKLW
jgi:hypothetical protein